MIIESFSYNDTKELGIKLGSLLQPGDVICLTGDLGAGKTAFSSGVAKGLGIDDDITSPTYTIVHEYHDGSIPFYHFDVYRINDVEEMYDIGFEEYIYGRGACVIEWASLIEEIIPKENLWIDIRVGDTPDHRRIELRYNGVRYEKLAKELK